MVALSVSISASTSPAAISWPSSTFHSAMLPCRHVRCRDYGKPHHDPVYDEVVEGGAVMLQLRCHAHLIASRTTAHNPALTTSAVPSRPISVIRRIDHGAAWAGCGEAGP